MDYRNDGRNPYGARGGYVDRAPYGDRGGDFGNDMRRDYGSDMRGDFAGDYGSDMRRDYGSDMRRDYDGNAKLSPEKLHKWTKMLMMDVDDKYKQYFRKEQIISKAEQMGIEFEKFTPEEFYTTVIMMFTDFNAALGTASVEVYIKMAKAFLCDADASVKYGKKLAKYYAAVVED